MVKKWPLAFKARDEVGLGLFFSKNPQTQSAKAFKQLGH
jgi:hypothetical protein